MAVKVGGQTGYIDTKGKFVINPQFARSRGFSEGLAAFEDADNRKWGFVGKDGTVVIPPTFDSAANFREGLESVMVGSLWGFIDKTGKIAIKPQFFRADDPNDPFARYREPWCGCDFHNGIARVPMRGKTAYISTVPAK